jgi:PEP-CTERM motif
MNQEAAVRTTVKNSGTGRCTLFLLAAIWLVLLLGSPVRVKADSIYTYTGNPFTIFSGYSCPPECNLSGSFTLASPLADNLSLAQITPTAFSFTDGNSTWDPTTASSYFVVSTDASGAIIGWFLGYEQLLNPTVPTLLSESNTPFNCGVGCNAIDWSFNLTNSTAQAQVVNNPGTWQVVMTPEPGTLLLLGMALLCAIPAKRLSRSLRSSF